MKKINFLSGLSLFLGAFSMLSAADILLVGDPAADSTIGIQGFLAAEGHSVTQELRVEGPGNANDFDLVIMGRMRTAITIMAPRSLHNGMQSLLPLCA